MHLSFHHRYTYRSTYRHTYRDVSPRVNFGTSNWQWGYFHNTAGASFNTDAPGLVKSAQAVFDADWESGYAVPLPPGP